LIKYFKTQSINFVKYFSSKNRTEYCKRLYVNLTTNFVKDFSSKNRTEYCKRLYVN